MVCGVELGWVAQIVDIEFDRRESIGDHAPRPGGAALGRAGRLVPVAAVGIEPYAVAELAAEQAEERLARSFGGKVPQGDLDAAQRNQEDARLRAGEDMVAAELFPAMFDIARILADELVLELRDEADDRGSAGVGIGFAVADEAFIGVDAHQRRLTVIGDDGGLYVDDFHIR